MPEPKRLIPDLRRLLARLSVPLSLRVTLSAFVGSLLLGLGLIACLGFPLLAAIRVAVEGAFGDTRAIADTLVFMTPRLLVALGALVAIRGGMFNLGGEGQLQMGAIGAMLPFLAFGDIGPALLPMAILCGALCGALWGVIPAVLKLWRGADEIIVTLLMNFIAIYWLKYLVQGPMRPKGSTFNMSAQLPRDGLFLPLIEGTRLHMGVILAVLITLGVWVMLQHTAFGLKLRASGQSPGFVRLQGESAGRTILTSMALSGAIGGLAGTFEVLGVQYRLIDGFSSGLGFEGLAVAFLAGLEPFGALVVSLYFGAINNAALALQSTLSIPAALADVLSGLPILLLAVISGAMLTKGRPVWTSTR
ncbi:ABC transporter permease [Pseudomonas typographi]|uniref:ABC transporter permease n=1 Tax=Pseudomonas typographi TaxID=2715964 RepID=A0ABR7Z2J3_9PSED|nr:ABC transporter permease [Pseudomonas typographi]MBD1550294.1 ABC transporter permease [Pseudomonas typographi]MBD1585940.1 ABC transporter permease [Pseudomonas typographi]MBD1599695.1 ABC transporter permease [Pseudomonas typographi]